MGNGQYVSVLFVIPVIMDIHRHTFKIFTLVSEIHDHIDLVMGMKNIFKLEGIIDSQDSCFSFLSRSTPFFPVTAVKIAPKPQKTVVIDAPFVEELSGIAIVKILDMKEQTKNMIKLKFFRNKVVLRITNKTHKTVSFRWTEMTGVIDLRSLGFYKIKQEVLQEHLGKHYHFELADDVCNQYNRFVNLMRKEEENSEGKYPWLEDTDKRKYITAVEIAPKPQKTVVIDAPFVEELSGIAIVKILDMKEQAMNMIKLKFIRNKAVLKITNEMHDTMSFGQTEMIGVVDLRSLGFYKIKHEVLQEHLGIHYHFQLADDICNQYNRFVNLIKREEENSEGKYPWLEDTDEGK